MEACATCTQNCILFHGTNKASPSSFFKVMVKRQCLTILHIPPRFGRIVSDLVDKKVILKDLNGQQWKVKVSKVNGSIAFEEGWDVFSMDHGLEVGYFLVFNYNKDSHFDVKIYDTSACERLDFSKERNQRKRSRDKNGSQVKEGMLVTQGYNALAVTKPDVPKMKCQHREVDLVGMQNIIESAQLMCISEHREDPYHLTSLEFEGKEREDQSRSVDGTMKISNADSEVSKIHHGSHVYQNDASATMCDKEPVFEWILGTEVALDAPELGMSERNSLGETDKSTYDKTSTLKFEENNENKMIMSNADTHKCQSAESLGEMSKKIKKEIAMAPDLEAAGLPKEEGELGHRSHSFNQDNESHFKKAAPLSFVIPNHHAYLELPTPLPLLCRKRIRMKRMVVLLRDPLRRLWPVVYHEKPGLKILTHGWSDFSRANNIQESDECIFEPEPENKSEYILAVRVVHK